MRSPQRFIAQVPISWSVRFVLVTLSELRVLYAFVLLHFWPHVELKLIEGVIFNTVKRILLPIDRVLEIAVLRGVQVHVNWRFVEPWVVHDVRCQFRHDGSLLVALVSLHDALREHHRVILMQFLRLLLNDGSFFCLIRLVEGSVLKSFQAVAWLSVRDHLIWRLLVAPKALHTHLTLVPLILNLLNGLNFKSSLLALWELRRVLLSNLLKDTLPPTWVLRGPHILNGSMRCSICLKGSLLWESLVISLLDAQVLIVPWLLKVKTEGVGHLKDLSLESLSVFCLLFNRLYLLFELSDLFFHLFHESFVIFYFHVALSKFLDEVPLLYLVLRNNFVRVYQLYPNLRQ